VSTPESRARLELKALLEGRLVSDTELDAAKAVLAAGAMGYLAASAAGWPYIIPMAFVYDGAALYFHGGEGLMSSVLGDDPRVCIAVTTQPVLVPGVSPCETTFCYESVLAFGRAALVEGDDEREAALRAIVAKYRPSDTGRPFLREGFASTLVYKLNVDALTYRSSGGE
jgi:uncharacterized protein